MPFQVLVAGAVLAVVLTQGCAPDPDPPSEPVAAVPSPSLESLPSPIGGSAPIGPIPTPPPGGGSQSSIDLAAQTARAVSLQMGRECGFCGDDWWHYELPLFRLYDDGLMVFRAGDPDPRVVPYRSAWLSDPQRDELIGFALDDGGLRDSKANYPGSGDDAGSTTFEIHSSSGGETTIKTVRLSDTFGEQVDDQEMRDRLQRLADTLFNIESWLRAHDIETETFEPSAYTAAMLWMAEGETIEPWPWADLQPSDFAETWPYGPRLARLTPDQARHAGVSPGGDRIGTLWSSPGMVADVYVRPVLPGDDVPGAFGLRPDMVAVTVTDRLRVRSLPEVSDASVKLEPVLEDGDALYIVDGPVDGSGYRWYQVFAPRADLIGWVAWADKTGTEWIVPRPLSCTPSVNDAIALEVGYALMNLACYMDRTIFGEQIIGNVSGDGLRCGDQGSYYLEPDWLRVPLSCRYAFQPSYTGAIAVDVISSGVVHPSVEEPLRTVLAALANPIVGGVVEVTGQFDHPDARSCTATGDRPPSPLRAILECRSTFVITDIRPVD